MARGTTSAALSKLLKRAEKISVSDLVLSTNKKNTPAEVTELVANVLAGGIRANATAIHIEPRPDGVHVRHRIDGVLHEAQSLPRAVEPVLLAGLKILVHLPIAEAEHLPLHGTTTVTVQEKPYRLQIATIPVEDGEKAVVQLNHLSSKAPSLEQLGLWGPNLKALSEAITSHRGLVVLAGPHDAGQAEMTYSILSHVSSPATSIATLEDPILYRIPGATQTAVNTRVGLDFAHGLKTLLRQDANIIMVSNLGDSVTTRLAVDGALSGRLIFAGLHTESTAGSLGYMVAAGVEPFMIAHALRVIVGQRVVRRLCENCKQIYTPPEQEMISILRSLGIKTAAQLQRVRELEQQAIEEKVVVGASPASDPSFITKLYRASKDGCGECSRTGYRGSVGLYEVLAVSDTIEHLITGRATPEVIEQQAIQEGMPTLQMDGLVKVLLGLTSVDEVAAALQ